MYSIKSYVYILRPLSLHRSKLYFTQFFQGRTRVVSCAFVRNNFKVPYLILHLEFKNYNEDHFHNFLTISPLRGCQTTQNFSKVQHSSLVKKKRDNS